MAMELNYRLGRAPTRVLSLTKQLLNRSLDNPLEDQLAAEAENFAACGATEDFAEGVAAFVEKRAAKFKGT